MIELLLVLVSVALVVACGAFVAAEFSFVTVDRSRVDREADEGDRRARGVRQGLRTLSTQLSAAQVEKHHPQAVVVFIGANEGYPMPGPNGKDIPCCSPEWAAVYANRVRQVIDTYRQDGRAKVYWLTVPLPRDPARQRIASVVNQSVVVVRIIDTDEYFSPDDRYSDSITVDGNDQIVRESDGIHLNDAGSSLLADRLLDRIDLDFTR